MTKSWLTRLTASFCTVAFLGSMALLAGCDDCDKCHDASVNATDEGSISTAEETSAAVLALGEVQ
jgi:hypothetical protein